MVGVRKEVPLVFIHRFKTLGHLLDTLYNIYMLKKIKIPKSKQKTYTGNSFSKPTNSTKKLTKNEKLLNLKKKK
jgi:hypothetical protein